VAATHVRDIAMCFTGHAERSFTTVFSQLVAIAIMMLSVGASIYDVQVLSLTGASAVWLYHTGRCTRFPHGVCWYTMHALAVPCVVLVGITPAITLMSVRDEIVYCTSGCVGVMLVCVGVLYT
jgi:hypothetical protein